jgi:CRISPR-associated protein Cst2
MAHLHSLSVSARVTLDLHNLNSEGTEGNQQQTRMVHIIDQKGRRAIVNAVSGDMFKHILVEHLIPLLQDADQPLSPGAAVHDADRINAANPTFIEFCEKEQEFVDDGKKVKRRALESEIMTKMLAECSLTDMAGALVTRGRSVGRKSVAEFGWVVGLPSNSDANRSQLQNSISTSSTHLKAAVCRLAVIPSRASRQSFIVPPLRVFMRSFVTSIFIASVSTTSRANM